MKKALIFIATALSLSVIYAAGWASGSPARHASPEPAAVRAEELSEEVPEVPECPDSPDGGFQIKLPFPHIGHRHVIRPHR